MIVGLGHILQVNDDVLYGIKRSSSCWRNPSVIERDEVGTYVVCRVWLSFFW